jgi:hypothetical protein
MFHLCQGEELPRNCCEQIARFEGGEIGVGITIARDPLRRVSFLRLASAIRSVPSVRL